MTYKPQTMRERALFERAVDGQCSGRAGIPEKNWKLIFFKFGKIPTSASDTCKICGCVPVDHFLSDDHLQCLYERDVTYALLLAQL